MSRIIKIKYVESKITGGHYCFESQRSKKPFQNPMNTCISVKLYDSDTIADVGAYVGEYSIWCALQRVKKVLSYEPTPRTFKLLQRNAIPPMIPINKAVTGNKNKNVTLYISKGIGVTNSIVKEKNEMMIVNAICYEKAVEEATVVKIDVEGAEYTYNIIQPNLRAIILEFHPLVGVDWKTLAMKIMSDIKSAGFKTIKEPTFKHGWDLIGSWVR